MELKSIKFFYSDIFKTKIKFQSKTDSKVRLNPYIISLDSFLTSIGKQCRPRSDAAEQQNVASDHGLLRLLTVCSIKIKNATQKPLKWK